MNDIYTKQIIRKRCRCACYIRIVLAGSDIFCFLLLHLLIIKIKLWIPEWIRYTYTAHFSC